MFNQPEACGNVGIAMGAVCAAEYVRMSTESQQFSIANQSAKIREYADQHGMRIVRTYADPGKSGLTIAGRKALQRLIADVTAGADFQVILVYDVSRWGRFQDTDESAHYEYICRAAGVQVIYCAEPFPSDASGITAIFKSVKRAMAAEFSRDLSVKVFCGQSRSFQSGFRAAGAAPYGLSRLLVDAAGKVKYTMQPGECKSLTTDKTLLVPGPQEEIEVVQRIFHMFASGTTTALQIVTILNKEGVPGPHGRTWRVDMVRNILNNEDFIGTHTYNKQPRIRGKAPLHSFNGCLRFENAFPPIVPVVIFDQVQKRLVAMGQSAKKEQLLADLHVLYQQNGTLNAGILRSTPDPHCHATYRRFFGSVQAAYALAGFCAPQPFQHIETARLCRQARKQLETQILEALPHACRRISPSARTTVLEVNGEISFQVLPVPCGHDDSGRRLWVVKPYALIKADMVLVARMAEKNLSILDYYLFPGAVLSKTQIELHDHNPIHFSCFRSDTLEPLFALARQLPARTPL